MRPDDTQQNSIAIPIAIVIGFALIAIAIFFTDKGPQQQSIVTEGTNTEQAEVAQNEPRLVDETDFIRGNPNAPILLIEYSDYDCPFCKEFHDSMNLIMEEFGVDGRVAWTYRQFPLKDLHPNSPRISEAALCVGDIGGNAAFWQFSDLIFEQREVTEKTSIVRLPEYAERVGIDRATYLACMNSDRMQQAVVDSLEDGFNAGVRGTPHSYVIVGNQREVIKGALSYESLRSIIVSLLEQLDGSFETEAVGPSSQSSTEEVY